MTVVTKGFFVLESPTSFQNYHPRFQNRLEIDWGIYKGLQKYKFYRQFAVQSSDIFVNKQYL